MSHGPWVGDEVGLTLGVGLAAVGLGLAVVGEVVVPPVHVTPLRAKEVGAGLLPFQVPLKPNAAVPPVAIEPL
jgi:hypothetical protein